MILLFFLCLIVNIITIRLYLNSIDKNDKKILLFMIMGQFISMYGYLFDEKKLIELSHIIFFISLVLGSLFFKSKYNKLLILATLIITIISREILNDCLFCIASDNTKLINIILPYDIIYNILLIMIIIKI